MKIIEPYFSIESMPDGKEALKALERAGRTAYKSEDKITEDSAEKFVAMVIRRGHTSVLEHCSASVRIICDRGVTHEIVRHRIGVAYTQESTRFCNYGTGDDGVVFISPCFWLANDPSSDILLAARVWWEEAMNNAESAYLRLLDCGATPQEARSVLPNSLKTEIVCTFTFRAWRHFFGLRTAKGAHPQMRQIAVPLLAEFRRLIPVVFDDIGTVEL